MSKKLLVSVLLCFFVFSLGTVAQEEKDEKDKILKEEKAKAGNIIYVDDAIGDDDGDGSEKRPFKTINKALSVANSEDSIKVGPGIYYESLRIRIDRITIEGSGSGITTINGGTSGHTIDAKFCDYLVISGFTISEGLWNGIRIFAVHQAVVDDCVIEESGGKGLFITYNSNAWIYNCRMINNDLSGVRVHASSNAQLYDCTISNNAEFGGFGVRSTNNASLSLYNCEVKDHTVWGIAIGRNAHLYMSGCSVHHNQVGLHVNYGAVADLFHVAEENRNQIFDNLEGGIRLTFGSKAMIAYADIRDNNNFGIATETSSVLWLWAGITISNHHAGIGVIIDGFAQAFLGEVIITNNNIGVHIYSGSQANCNPETITGNNTDIISDCPYCQK